MTLLKGQFTAPQHEKILLRYDGELYTNTFNTLDQWCSPFGQLGWMRSVWFLCGLDPVGPHPAISSLALMQPCSGEGAWPGPAEGRVYRPATPWLDGGKEIWAGPKWGEEAGRRHSLAPNQLCRGRGWDPVLREEGDVAQSQPSQTEVRQRGQWGKGTLDIDIDLWDWLVYELWGK